MKCILADAGLIIALCKINQLEFVFKLFHPCFITQSVYDELDIGCGSAYDCIESAIKLKHVTVKTSNPINSELLKILDDSEATSISLALEIKESILLINEAKGRQIAQHLGIETISVIGLLILAKKNKFISRVVPLLIKVRDNGYWLTDQLLNDVSILTGEVNG
jgi:predicted nucleic acid-binding protein